MDTGGKKRDVPEGTKKGTGTILTKREQLKGRRALALAALKRILRGSDIEKREPAKINKPSSREERGEES